jgi:hypothetical protein
MTQVHSAISLVFPQSSIQQEFFMHRLAGWLGHGTSDATQTLELMLSHCSVTRPSYTHTEACCSLAANLPLAMDGPLSGAVITGRPRFAPSRTACFAAGGLCTARNSGAGRVPIPQNTSMAISRLAVLDHQANSVFLALDRIGAEKLAFASQSVRGLVFLQPGRHGRSASGGGHVSSIRRGCSITSIFSRFRRRAASSKGVEKLLPAQWAHWQKRRTEPRLLLGAEIPGHAAR